MGLSRPNVELRLSLSSIGYSAVDLLVNTRIAMPAKT